ncbi:MULTISPECIES: tetratricopeptide repeat protein [Shewanella]|jgi:tetratricopeptide (TPR) repeat protein|uniref:tetratricopeptide repeat protein n=1 Tax=Shewanella TaxID=22 RepID=UPI00200D8048|nr:tetratricopeptide repeat protein [Shewanella basaltis]MCL1113512.1 tetratricopeptide repeat protein [Shewanella basaltis]
MRKVTSIATALLLSVCTSAMLSGSAFAAEKCEIDKRQSRAVGESAAKKVQKSFEAYTEGNLDQAISILLEANAKNDFDKAYVDRMLGNFYAEKGQMGTAIKYLKGAVDADILGGTDHAATLRLYADLLLQEKKFKEAIPYYYKWMDFTCKSDAQMYRRIGIAHTELKEWNKVLEVADKGLSLAEAPDKGLYQMKLTAYFNQKKYKDAVKVLEIMVPLFQDDKRLWVQLAQFYLMTEDYDKSLATYDLAYKNGFLETDGNITRLAQLLAQKGSPYKAATIFEKHMKSGLIAENEKSLTTLAGFYHNAKELKEAAYYYGKAASVSGKGDLFLKQGRILALDQKFNDAIPVLKKALDAGIDNPGEAQFELALAYLSLKKYKSAYNRAVLAANDKKTERSAKSYISYIKEKARIHNITL